MAVVIGLGPWIISSSLTSSMSLRSIAASPAPATNFLSNEGNVHQFEATSRFNPSMAIVVVVLLSTFFFMGFVSVYLRKCVVSERERDIPYQRAPGAGQGRPIQGLDKATIGSFPVVRFSLVKGQNKGKLAIECTVCLTEFQEQENIRVLPKCGHSFHLDCIDMWLFSHTTCPLCRQSLVLNPEEISLVDSFSTEEGFALERRLGESGRNITQSIADQGHEVRLTLIDAPRQNEVAVDRRDEARERESTVALSKNIESVKITAQDLENLEKLSASSATYNAKSRKTEDGSSSMSASLITSTSSTLMHRSQSCSVLAEMLKRSHGTDEDKSSSL